MARILLALLWSGAALVSTTWSAEVVVPSCEDPSVSDRFGGVDHEAYLEWVRNRGNDAYNVSVYFASASTSDNTVGAALHWTMDEEYLYVAFAARATGWIGFGISEAGGMKGADIVYYESSNPGHLTDAYANDKAMPITDDCQDWSFVNARQEGGFLIVEGVRRLDTLDHNDHAIIHDEDTIVPAQRLIFAWGDSDSISYHGPHTARGGIRWYGEGDEIAAFRLRMNATADGYFDMFTRNYPIKPEETQYVNFCFTWSDFLDQGLPANGSISVIGAEMFLDPDGGRFVHHANIAGTTKPSNESFTCFGNSDYDYLLYGWAPGTLPFEMPQDVGFTLGPGENGKGLQGFKINMHYNNPQLVEGAIDNGGLRVYYVHKPLKHELGLMLMGDFLARLKGTHVGTGLNEWSFDCDPGCSSLALTEPVTVVHEFFHMHYKGTGAITTQMRDGEVVREARTNYFDFDQAGIFAVRQQSYQVFPGDSFRTQCVYSNPDVDTSFGIGSSDEMCEAILLYYPATRLLGLYPWACIYDVPVQVCNSSLTHTLLPQNESLFRTFGTSEVSSSDQCSAKLPDARSMCTKSTPTNNLWILWLTTTFLLVYAVR